MQDIFVLIKASWAAEAFSQSRSKGPDLLLGLANLEEKNGSCGKMSDQKTLNFWTKTSHPRRSAGNQQILGGLRFVLLCTVYSRLTGETVWQKLPVRKMHQWILHLWSRMGWRPVPTLPREVQVSVCSVRDQHKITCGGFVWDKIWWFTGTCSFTLSNCVTREHHSVSKLMCTQF